MTTASLTATRTCRLLYYGQPGTGKRENLRLIHQFIPPEQRLVVATDDPERQIAFKFRQEGKSEWQVLVQAVDVGKERFRAAGMMERPPFDGVIFVVPSVGSQLDQSLAAFESLKTFLDTWGLDLMRVPVVLQYNRRPTGEAVSVDRLESLLNPWGLLSFPSNTLKGEGVRETLKAVLGLAINHINEKRSKLEDPDPIEVSMVQASHAQDIPAETLGFDNGPPVPGREPMDATRLRSEAIYNEMSPPLVVPVRIPRRLLQNHKGQLRILLEVQIED
ncbi:MAG: hypothetical protein ABIK96_15895 [bacterium]